jgi:hypothetical protein
MKKNDEFDLLYAAALKECIDLIEEGSLHEKEQISLAIRIGAKVDELTAAVEDKESVFKRLARDIFRARGKVVNPSKVAEYRQLYLNFQPIDTVTTMEQSLMNDVTVRMLTEIALNDGRPKNKPAENVFLFLRVLRKAGCLLDGFEPYLEEKQPDGQEATEIIKELEALRTKADTLLNAVQNSEGRSQLDFLKKPDVCLPIAQYVCCALSVLDNN